MTSSNAASSIIKAEVEAMNSPNIYIPYPIPQSIEELQADMNAFILSARSSTRTSRPIYQCHNSPTIQADVDQAEANSDSMANE